jgi:hypothetical protein
MCPRARCIADAVTQFNRAWLTFDDWIDAEINLTAVIVFSFGYLASLSSDHMIGLTDSKCRSLPIDLVRRMNSLFGTPAASGDIPSTPILPPQCHLLTDQLDISTLYSATPLHPPGRTTRNHPQRFRFYAVCRGHHTGIFTPWSDCKLYTDGTTNEYMGFKHLSDAQAYLANS